MPHDPSLDGCPGCDIWPCDQPSPPPTVRRDEQTRDGDWLPQHGKGWALLHARPCRDCGGPVRVADLGYGIQCRVHPEPIPVADVNRAWHAWWWSDMWGLVDRIHTGDARHAAAGELLYVLHPCDHRPRSPQPQPAPRERSTVTAPTFGTARPPGEGASNADLQGKLLLIKVTEKKTGFVTSSGLADVVVADVVDLTGGEEHPDNFLFGKVLFGQFEMGVTYLGTIGRGVAKPGQSAPWLFTGAEGDPAAVATAQQYLAYKAQQAPAAAPATAPFPAQAPAAPAAAVNGASPPWAQQ